MKKVDTQDPVATPAAGRRRLLAHGAGVAALLALAPGRVGAADKWPTKSVRVVIPFAGGASADVVARLLASGLSEQLGQAFIVDARPGANGIIGTDTVAKAAPDGYTLLVHSSSYALNAALYKKLPFDTQKDLTPIVALAAPQSFVLVVNSAVPIHNPQELIAYAKARPGTLSYGSAGVGNVTHLAGELLAKLAGIRLAHIPYKGSSAAMNDLLGGQTQMMFNGLVPVQQFVQDGKLRIVAQTGARRMASLPNVPTLAESGVPGYELTSWYGLYGPAKLPTEIVDLLNAAALKIMSTPEVLKKIGQDAPPSGSPQAFEKFSNAEIARYRRLAKDIGISLETS